MTDNFELEEPQDPQELKPVEVDPKKVPDIDSKYRLILLAAQRAKQIQRGALARVDLDVKKIKPTTIAREEFRQSKVNFEFTKEK